MTNPAIRYVAELSHVREVSLLGTADLGFWKDRLQGEGLVPAEKEGRAQILIIAAHAKFMGLRFTEVSFSVLVTEGSQEKRREAAFLLRAFNSSRMFAFCERVFFATPYFHADCRLSTTSPVSIEVAKGGDVVFRAAMRTDPDGRVREASRTGEDSWAGPVFLPRSRGEGNVFFARIAGHTRTYPFLPPDIVSIKAAPGAEVLQALIDSRFAGDEWAIRDDAMHAKSKTYRRSETLALDRG